MQNSQHSQNSQPCAACGLCVDLLLFFVPCYTKNLFDKLMDDDEAAGFLRDKCFMFLVRYI